MTTIPMPVNTEDDFGKVIYKLIQIDDIVTGCITDSITLDFTNAKFLHCIFLSGLFCLIKKWEKELNKKIAYKYVGSIVESYLDTIHFFQGFNIDQFDSLDYYATKRYTPLIVFPTIEYKRESAIFTITDLIKSQIKPNRSVGQAVDHFIIELTNNVGDHSESHEGFISVQAYPRKNFMDICIADFGVGILRSYDKSDKFFPKTELDAINMAIDGKSTKDRHISRGFGISTSKNILIEELRGRFVLWSGNGMYVQTFDQPAKSFNIKNRYPGCFICLRLRTDSTFDFYKYMN